MNRKKSLLLSAALTVLVGCTLSVYAAGKEAAGQGILARIASFWQSKPDKPTPSAATESKASRSGEVSRQSLSRSLESRQKASREEKGKMTPQERSEYKTDRAAAKWQELRGKSEDDRKVYDDARAARKTEKAKAVAKPKPEMDEEKAPAKKTEKTVTREKATREQKEKMSESERTEYKKERSATKFEQRKAATPDDRKKIDKARDTKKVEKVEKRKAFLEEQTGFKELSAAEVAKLSPQEYSRYKSERKDALKKQEAILKDERKRLRALQTPKERRDYLINKYGKFAAFLMLPASAGGAGLDELILEDDDEGGDTKGATIVQVNVYDSGTPPPAGVGQVSGVDAGVQGAGAAGETFEAVETAD